MEAGRKPSDLFWSVYLNKEGEGMTSNFSIGSSDTGVDPLDKSGVLQEDAHLSPGTGATGRPISDEQKRTGWKPSLEVRLQDQWNDPFLGRQRCESVESAVPVRRVSRIADLKQMYSEPTLEDMLHSGFLGQQNSVFCCQEYNLETTKIINLRGQSASEIRSEII